MAESDATEIDPRDGKESPKRRFDARDWDHIAEWGIEEWERRKKARSDRERAWKEIDRQIAMEPDVTYKYIIKNGSRVLDTKKAWMAEVELPLQAQALEVLTADARRMMFPDSGSWFRAHAEMTDEYLAKADFQAMILGDEAEVPSQINQDNADKLVEGYLTHIFRQQFGDRNEDFFTRLDRINAESLKYGMGIGRARMQAKSLYFKTGRGVRRETQRFPVLLPCSIKNLYLDDTPASMHSIQMLEPTHIAVDHIRLENLKLAANRGSSDPDAEDGGWMPKNCKDVVEDDNGFVTLLEIEGDLVVPRKTTRSMILPGAVVTIVMGGKDKGGNASHGVVRCRFRKSPVSSYLLFPYHYEGADDTYPTSPLMKGRPVQMMATDALNRLLDSAMLKNHPPVGYDKTDLTFAQSGGPEIYPGATWASSDPGAIKAHTEIGGDPSSLSAAMAAAINLYAELTGVLPARLGAQTVSHTTAFAKDAELQRGAVRTVDYVRQCGQGPMTRWLDMAYPMARDAIGSRDTVSFFIEAYGGYVEVTRDQLPERATFEWFGSGGPAEEAQKKQARLQSLALALQMDQMGVQFQVPPDIKLREAKAQVLREGGWTDVDAIMGVSAPPPPLAIAGPAAPAAAVAGIPEVIGQ